MRAAEGAARRVLSGTPSFPSAGAQGAAGRGERGILASQCLRGLCGAVHSQFLSGGPFAQSSQGVFGMTSGGAAPLRKPGGKSSNSKPVWRSGFMVYGELDAWQEHLRYHGRAAINEDDRPKMTIGSIDNRDGSYTSEFYKENGVAYARDVQGSAYPQEKIRQKMQENQRPVHEMVTMEASSYYESSMGEM